MSQGYTLKEVLGSSVFKNNVFSVGGYLLLKEKSFQLKLFILCLRLTAIEVLKEEYLNSKIQI